jgi:hypothetical protein
MATPVPRFEKLNQDLNEGAGGTFNYLCIGKRGDIKVKDITVRAYDQKV